MIRGLRPTKFKDSRTYDFHRTFGTISSTIVEFNFDQTGVMPNQNAEGFPNACTAYTTTGMASNSDKTNYDDKLFTYEKTKLMMGVEGDVPCDQMTSLKSASVWGCQGLGKNDAFKHIQSPYFIVKKLNGSYFDGMISAMQIKKGTLSVGSMWLPEFETVGSTGIVRDFVVPKSFNEGHNWEAVGVKMIDGEPRIICKSWQGANFGDKGYIYFSKVQIDSLLSVRGSGVFGQKHAEPEDIVRVKMNIIETIISFIQRLQLLSKLGRLFGIYA